MSICPHFGICGGCVLQHLPIAEQLIHKKNQLIWQLINKRIAPPQEIPFISAKAFGYRTRMDYVFSDEGLALRERENYQELVPIKECLIANQRSNELLIEINNFFKENLSKADLRTPENRDGAIKFVVIRTPEFSQQASISFMINQNSPRYREQKELLLAFCNHTTANHVICGNVGIHQDQSTSRSAHPLKGNIYLEEILNGKTISFHSQSFFQNNSYIAEAMVEHCRKIINQINPKPESLLDLYGGCGTFGIALADLFKSIKIIDCDKINIAQAQQNIINNNIENGECYCQKIEDCPGTLFENNLVIIDPPRAGLHPKVIKYLMQAKPKQIIYVSCNPETLATDLSLLLAVYKLKSITGFDHFPHTSHIETISELVLK